MKRFELVLGAVLLGLFVVCICARMPRIGRSQRALGRDKIAQAAAFDRGARMVVALGGGR